MNLINWLFDTTYGNMAVFISIIVAAVANLGIFDFLIKKVSGDASF